MPSVLNTALYLPFGTRGVTPEAGEAALVQDLLCYETVWILTEQMGAVPKLVEVMGIEAFERAVAEGTLRFVHDRHILVWPKMPWYGGAVPFEAIASLPGETGAPGYSQIETSEMVTRLLAPSVMDTKRRQALARRVEDATVDFGRIEDLPRVSEDESIDRVDAHLAIYEEAVRTLPHFPVKAEHLARLRRDLRRPGLSPLPRLRGTATYGVVTMQHKPGAAAMSLEDRFSPKLLGMLNLALAERFLSAHAALKEEATLHSEPAVEEVLSARAAAIRRAAAGEVDVVLHAASVCFPTLLAPGPLPYCDLLKARGTRSGRAFRQVVAARDANPSAELIQEFYRAAFHPSLAKRFGVTSVRLLATSALGLLGSIPGLMASAVDSFWLGRLFERGNAQFYVDHHLRRISSDAIDGGKRRRTKAK